MTNVKANLQRNPFDLSERHLFSGKIGQLLPVYNKQVVPGDYFEIDPVLFLRTMKLNTASFARMRQHLEFYFVPYSQLWHEFPQFKYQRQDPVSSVLDSGNPLLEAKYSPYIDLCSLYNNIMMGGGSSATNAAVVRTDEFGFFEICNRVRLADLLGYGSLRNYFKPNPNDADDVIAAVFPEELQAKHVTLWPFLAYQKIWSDVYRNPWFDNNIDPRCFNVDDINGRDLPNSNINYARHGDVGDYNDQLDGIFKLRYRQWKKDYFTGLFPDQQFGDVSMIVGSQQVYNVNGSYVGNVASLVVNGNQSSPTNAVKVGNSLPFIQNTGVSTIDLRRAELLQVWKEKTLRAGSRTQQQQLAHFGVSSEYISDMHVKPLGGVSQVIDVSEVVSTSMNTNGAGLPSDGLGELAGKGVSLSTGNKIRFNVKDDGIIMAIFSILPESEYSAFGVSAEHMRIEPFDYFTPAFQNLGFKAVVGSELDLTDMISNSDGEDVPGERRNKILGYAPPYYDMKVGIDKVHGEFIPELIRASDAVTENTNIGSLSAFDVARRGALTAAGTLPFYYVSPRVSDSVFAENADSWELSDQFYCNMYLDIKAVRPMSVLGLPNF